MRLPVYAVAGLLIVSSVHGQSADAIQKQLAASAQKLESWTADPVFLGAVRAQNARNVPLAELRKLDEQWISGGANELVKKLTTGKCADRLRELANAGGYGEAFVMDKQGAIVCATARTSDYWQGDEAKWIRAFAEGKGAVFIDRPKTDDSSKQRIAQISLPILDNGNAIGVITIGVPPAP